MFVLETSVCVLEDMLVLETAAVTGGRKGVLICVVSWVGNGERCWCCRPMLGVETASNGNRERGGLEAGVTM